MMGMLTWELYSSDCTSPMPANAENSSGSTLTPYTFRRVSAPTLHARTVSFLPPLVTQPVHYGHRQIVLLLPLSHLFAVAQDTILQARPRQSTQSSMS